jgi:predicted nucleic acid-binding protein
MNYLFDTSALLAHVRGEPGAERVQQLFEREEGELLICSVSQAELARRLRDLGASPEEAWTQISDYLQAVDEVVPVDQEMAHESDRLSVSATTRLPLVDALIAAAACTRQAVLVHRDSHMRGVAGVVQQLDLDAG